MPTVAFDTLKYVESLKKAGVDEKQAIAMSEAQRDIFSQALDGQLATKQDIAEVKQGISELKQTMVEMLAAQESAIRKDMTDIMKWMLGGFVAMTGVFATIVKVF